MKKKLMPAIMAAGITMSAIFGFNNSITANANELTQITDASKVNYGNNGTDFTAEDIELLKSMFDVEYYLNMNPDLYMHLQETVGEYKEEQLKEFAFVHFYRFGIFEGRSLSADFNVAAFASAYGDLKALYGDDILSYYKYAATHDLEAEGRTITTLAEAASAGITVTSVTNENIAITPEIYYKAEEHGIWNIDSILPILSANANAAEGIETSYPEYISYEPASTPEEYVNRIVEYDNAYDKFLAEHRFETITPSEVASNDVLYAYENNGESNENAFLRHLRSLGINISTFYIVMDNDGHAALCRANTGADAFAAYAGYDSTNVAKKNNGEALLYNTVNHLVIKDSVLTLDDGTILNRYCHRAFLTDQNGQTIRIQGGHAAPYSNPTTIDVAAACKDDAPKELRIHFTNDNSFYVADTTGENYSVAPTFTLSDIQAAANNNNAVSTAPTAGADDSASTAPATATDSTDTSAATDSTDAGSNN